MKVELTINEFGIHISQPGRPGSSYDIGEHGEDLEQAMKDAADELVQRYKAQAKNKEALDSFFNKL